MNEYVVKDYTEPDAKHPTISIVTEDELWKILQDGKERKVSVFKLGDCILDWS